jgi:hypothetical protein
MSDKKKKTEENTHKSKRHCHSEVETAWYSTYTYEDTIMLHVTRLLSGSKWIKYKGRRGSDRMVVESTTTCGISAYHH